MALKLVIGNKNYSSWSMRPWIALRSAKIPFEEEVSLLNDATFKVRLGALGSRTVPVLIDESHSIWESLAILEYLAEKFPDARLWPESAPARARARVLAAE